MTAFAPFCMDRIAAWVEENARALQLLDQALKHAIHRVDDFQESHRLLEDRVSDVASLGEQNARTLKLQDQVPIHICRLDGPPAPPAITDIGLDSIAVRCDQIVRALEFQTESLREATTRLELQEASLQATISCVDELREVQLKGGVAKLGCFQIPS